MKIYDITSPANEAELSRVLRSMPLTGAVLRLTVERQLDELSAARRVVASDEMDFMPETIHITRPMAILGSVTLGGVRVGEARIDAEDSDDDNTNALTLTILEYE